MTDQPASDAITAADPPPGFAPITHSAPFGAHTGPFFDKETEAGLVRAFRVAEKHCNQGGMAHGGMLMTFMDVVLGVNMWRAAGRPGVTVSMATDFVAAARLGDWVEGRAEVVRQTRSLVFLRGELTTGDRTVMTATGVFQLLAPRGGDTG